MPRIDVFDLNGKKVGRVELPSPIFAVSINEKLMAQAVRVYLSNQRRAKAKVKTRGEVKGSGRKIWRQKGTGRARHGDRYAPIFVGGGIAHGPTGKENYKLKLTKKMRRQALFSALTSKLQDGEVIVVKGLEKIKPKTKKMVKVIEKLGLKSKILLILPEKKENIIRAARNIKGVELALAPLLNTYQVLKGGKLLFMEESIKKLKETFLKS